VRDKICSGLLLKQEASVKLAAYIKNGLIGHGSAMRWTIAKAIIAPST
jgi:hypothetical protein